MKLNIKNPFSAEIGGLIIQITDDNSIWLRNFLPKSGYYIDDAKELIELMEQILKDEIQWSIGYKNGDWFETTFIQNESQIENEPEVKYQILSWSGNKDKII